MLTPGRVAVLVFAGTLLAALICAKTPARLKAAATEPSATTTAGAWRGKPAATIHADLSDFWTPVESIGLLKPEKVAATAARAGRPGTERREPGATDTMEAQREPVAPKELVERVGAWAEVFLDRCPSFTAVETREEQRAGKKGVLENKRVGLAEYSARRQDDGQVVESRKPMAAEGGASGEKGKHAEAAPVDARNSPFAIVARLAEHNQDRMKFVFAQDTSDPTVGVLSDYVLLGYRQIRGRGLAELDGKAVYPRGQAWVDPDDGRIFRIEDEVTYKSMRQSTEVEFSRDNPLQTWLPKQITIRTFEKGRLEQQVVITYSGFNPLGERVGSASRN